MSWALENSDMPICPLVGGRTESIAANLAARASRRLLPAATSATRDLVNLTRPVCRLDQWPAGLERSFAEAGYDVYNTMNGPSEFTVTGTLKTWDIMDRLPEIAVRTLLVGGRYDECTPGHLEEMHRRIAGSRLAIIEDASHLCFAEQPEEFNKVINSFMT